MKSVFAFPLAALLAVVSTPALAQYDWDGFYGAVHGGSHTGSNHPGEHLVFDTDGDGEFDNGVSTDPVLLINAFGPGFCGGAPNTGRPQAGCRNNFDDKSGDTGIRLGYDWQQLDLVVGVVAEYSTNDLTDNVTGFTTTLDTYTFDRQMGDVFSLRGRVGFTFGDGSNLLYTTIGYGQADVTNSFTTSDTTNDFTTSDPNGKASGIQWGLGYETFVAKHVTVGIEWINSSFDDDSDYVVHADGGIFDNDDPTTGTDFRRSNQSFDFNSTRLTVGWRFNDGDW